MHTSMGSKNKKKNSNGSGSHGNNQNMITDPRFASVHSDPRFQNPPKHKSKVAIDSRFNRMFTDKSFTSSSIRIDKRGKTKKDSSSQNPLKHYYRLDEDEEKEKKHRADVESNVEESDEEKEKKHRADVGSNVEESDEEKEKKHRADVESNVEESDEEKEKKHRADVGSNVEERDEEKEKKHRADVGSNVEESDESENESEKLKKRPDESSSDPELQIESEPSNSEEEDEHVSDVDSDTSSTGSDSDDGVYSEEEETLVPEENVPEIEKETHRLAVVNMDWNQVKAVDLYVLLSSFLPKGGQILSVAVYPSEFGLKRMEEEAVQGPVGLFDNDNKNVNEDDDDDEIDIEKLRAYELSRLRYYYAVVECDSIATADYLYKSCDGVEFERSSNKLDLRFIPDSMEFKHAPRDVATEAPGSYEGIDFQTRALQQSKIHLTWDEDEPQRSRTLKRKFNADQLAELELKEFLASDESGTDEGENDDDMEDRSDKRHKKQDMYRALIQSGDGSGGDAEKDDQDMEVTFNTGLEDISKRILEKKDKKSETVWEAHLQKRREKKKARKNRSKDSSEDESSDTDREPTEEPDDFFVEDTHVKKSKEARGRSAQKGMQTQETAEKAEASIAELELLLADEHGGSNLKGYNLKPKKAKGKKGKEIPDGGKIPTIDHDDPRFSSLITSPLFALDPTDPQFRRSAAYARQVAQKQQKGDREEMGRNEHPNMHGQAHFSDGLETGKDEQILPSGLPAKKDEHELSSLVKSIKMKSKQLKASSNDKVSGKKGKITNKLTKVARVL